MKEKEITIVTWQGCGVDDLIDTWRRNSAKVVTEADKKEDNSNMLPLRQYRIRIKEID